MSKMTGGSVRGQRFHPACIDSAGAVVAFERMHLPRALAVVLDFGARCAAPACVANPELGGPAVQATAPEPAAGPPLQHRLPHFRVHKRRTPRLAAARAGRRDRKVDHVETMVGVAW
jgi:hypothetical protein